FGCHDTCVSACVCTAESARHLRLTTLFFFNPPARPGLYTLSLHDALPIWVGHRDDGPVQAHHHHPHRHRQQCQRRAAPPAAGMRSEEHTSELQSLAYLVCRLLLEKKNSPFSTTRFRLSDLSRLRYPRDL